ncbi:hypothetical protein QL285_046395 [Trifolium repens]|nr:hypothetical protein QL285_046395 [Trifolium repens]
MLLLLYSVGSKVLMSLDIVNVTKRKYGFIGSKFSEMEAASNVQKDISNIVKYGMLILVIFSYMLPFIFFVILKGEMKL